MLATRLLLLLTALTSFSTLVLPAPTTQKVTTLSRHTRYDNQKLVRVPRSNRLLRAAEKLHLDVWAKSKDSVDIRVTSAQLKQLQRAVGPRPLVSEVLDDNIQLKIDAETEMLNAQLAKPVKISTTADWFTQYHTFDDIVTWLQELAKQYPKLVTYQASIGKSVEGKDIPLLKITSGNGDLASKKRIFLQGMQHAREWISGATMQFIANELASKYGSDSRITSALDNTEVVIVPVCNPDGYEYTWTDDRLWRKNLGANKSGVDPNRNWPDHWNDGGSSTDPTDDTYMGTAAASEPEVQALMAAYQATPNVIAAVDFHSYSQLILRPYGWTSDDSPDEAAFSAIGSQIQSAISAVAGTNYVSEKIVDLYVASGGANDWWYGLGTPQGQPKPYGIAIELSPDASDPDGYGFVLPPTQIVPVGNEIMPAMLTMIEYSLANPLGPQQ